MIVVVIMVRVLREAEDRFKSSTLSFVTAVVRGMVTSLGVRRGEAGVVAGLGDEGVRMSRWGFKGICTGVGKVVRIVDGNCRDWV